MLSVDRKLRVFLCHASQDRPVVREIYQLLNNEGWIDPWLDEKKLLPGEDWKMQIEEAVESSDAIIICLSNNSVTKEGYVQKEIRLAWDIADEKPEGTIFLIPLRLDDCSPPRKFRGIQYIDFFPTEKIEQAFRRLLESLRKRAGFYCDCFSCLAKGGKKIFDRREAEIHNDRGVSFAKIGQIDKAIVLFKTAITYDAKYAEPHHNLAFAYSLKSQQERAKVNEFLDEAIRHALMAVGIRDNYSDARCLLSTLYLELGQFEDALEQSRIVAQFEPQNGEAHYLMARVYYKQGNRSEAIREAELTLRCGGWEDEANNLLMALRIQGT